MCGEVFVIAMLCCSLLANQCEKLPTGEVCMCHIKCSRC